MRFLLTALLALASSIALAGESGPYPVIPLEQAKPLPRAIADEAFWVSGGLGAAHVSTYNALAYNLGLYGSEGRVVYGARVNGTRGAGGPDVRYGHEQALMLGHYLDHRNMTWLGIGISRLDGVGGRHPDQREIGVGLPMEFVFSPPGRHVAPELRFNVDLNKMNSFMMFTVGLRIGQLK